MFHRPSPTIPEAYIPKWSRSTLSEGFVPFPKKLMRCLGEIFTGSNVLAHLQVVLVIADSKRQPKNDVPFRPPTLSFLAYNAGMEEEEFLVYVYQLRDGGMVFILDEDAKHFDVDLTPLLDKIDDATSKGNDILLPE